MDEIVFFKGLIPKSLIKVEDFSTLPYQYEPDEENFKEHMRYPIEKVQLPDFILDLERWIYEILFKDYSDREKDNILVNKYQGNEGCNWHQDYDEPWSNKIDQKAARLVLTIGPDKIFKVRNIKTREVQEILLSHGDCVIMSENFDQYFEHSVPISNDGQVRYTFMITFGVHEDRIKSLFEKLSKMNFNLIERETAWVNHVNFCDGNVELHCAPSKCEECKPCLERYLERLKEVKIEKLHEKCIHGYDFLLDVFWKTHGHDYSCIHAREKFDREWHEYEKKKLKESQE